MEIANKENQLIVSPYGGRIIESKPLVNFNPYSNLENWVNIHVLQETIIPSHIHTGIEIITFVVKGTIVHFDEKANSWTDTQIGGVQVIHANSGFKHAEKYHAGTKLIQIWLEPNLKAAVKLDPVYKTLKAKDFPWEDQDGFKRIRYIGLNTPILPASRGVGAIKYKLPVGVHRIKLHQRDYNSICILSGSCIINDAEMFENDFTRVLWVDRLDIAVITETELLILITPYK
tara:strand:- start:72290 stop:72982 length:693 start_codon:yes stop_codon:yes gene_type:complete